MTILRVVAGASVCSLLMLAGAAAHGPLQPPAPPAQPPTSSAPPPTSPAQPPTLPTSPPASPTAPPASPTASPTAAPPRTAMRIYSDTCSSCHGPTLEGGMAQSLVDDTWAFGGDDQSLAETIRNGRAGTSMMAFKNVLSEQEIRALVIYIREQHLSAGRRGRAATPLVPLPDQVVTSEKQPFRVELVAEGLDTPWGFDWLPDGRMLVTERPGRLRIVENGTLLPEPIEGVPPVWVRQDGGLFDVAVHPQFAASGNGWIYLAFSLPGAAPGSSATKIVRARLQGTRLVDHQTLFEPTQAQYWVDNRHYGARFLFDAQGLLYYSIGDRGHDADSQDLASPYGKLHRIHDDGRIPADNPFVGRAGALPTIWSYGHRNQQGLAFHPVSGELYATEHGPRGGDELNRILPGRNYGWPVVTFGMNDDGTPITDRTAQEGMEPPVVQWTPSIAVCALEFYTGDRLPGWKHDLFATALAHRELRRLTLQGGREPGQTQTIVVHQEVLLKNLGRVRDVATGPDGYLYVALNEPGRIVRLVPAASNGPTTGSRPGRME